METAAEYLVRLRAEAADVLHWDWEQTLERAYCRVLPRGSSAVDVGGHAGRHARVLLDILGARDLLIVEPLPQECAHLMLSFGGRPGVRIIHAALSRELGRTKFIVNTSAREESGLRRRRYNDEAGATLEKIEVDVTSLDALFADQRAPRQLDFIKIDVEGAELDVLAGGEQTIQRYRPLISVEYGSPSFTAYGHEAGDLFDLAERWNYCLADLLGHRFETRDQWLETVDAYYWDFLMMPRERADALAAMLEQDAWPVARARAEGSAQEPGMAGSAAARESGRTWLARAQGFLRRSAAAMIKAWTGSK
ncbi:methyltransferase, FkbM family [Thiorhodovibrio winogradskyi]|uniref:Methyltransferase, FkbM family n=1 Tax=Thiorhodovibrio winogradskyi TaxID=77007 RepID=A0ABZ0S357_9GAMM|nr:FkbM family methyltransferase [Thiorhodovibrio winogradskyi]